MSNAQVLIPDQGPPGIPAFAIVGGTGFVMPPATGGPSAQQVTITLGPASDGSPTSSAWMFAPMPMNFTANGVALGVLVVVATPSATTVTLQNNGGATPNTSVPAGAGISQGGPVGPVGPSPATTLQTSFSMPAANAQTASLLFGSTAFMVPGQSLFVTTAGRMTVFSVIDATHAILTNTGDATNAAPNAAITQPQPVGVAGSFPGPPGPASGSVANATALTALTTANILPLATTIGVVSTKQLYYWDPNSVATPDGQNVIAASSTGNWISLMNASVPNILGETLVQGLGIDGESATTGIGVGVGATQAINLRWNPSGGTRVMQLTKGEFVSCSALVRIGSSASVAILTASNATPIVLALSTAASATPTSAFASGSRVLTSGVTGNNAANTGAYVNVQDGTHLALYSDAALTQPIAGTGAGTGGVVQSRDFASFQVRADFRECDGIVINATAGTSGSDVTVPIEPANAMPSLTSATCSLVWQNNTVQCNVTAPANVAVNADLRASYSRLPVAGSGNIPIVPQPATNSGPTEGNTTIEVTGGQFFTGIIAAQVAGIPASFVFHDDTHVTLTTTQPPNGNVLLLGGSGDISITTGAGTGSVGSSTAFTYVADIKTIALFAGLTLRYWGNGSSLTQSGGIVTGMTDLSGNGQNPTVFGSPTYTASSPNVTPPAPSVSFSGSSQDLEFSALNIGSAPSNLIYWAVARSTNAAAFQAICSYNSNGIVELGLNNTGKGTMGGGGVGATSASNIAGAGTLSLVGYNDGPTGTTALSVSNGTKVTATGGGNAYAAGAAFGIGGRQTHSSFWTGELFELAVLTGPVANLTTQVLNALEAVAHNKYGVP